MAKYTNKNKALNQKDVVELIEQFYCNQDDGDYNNNPCSKQCKFCKSAEELQQNNH